MIMTSLSGVGIHSLMGGGVKKYSDFIKELKNVIGSDPMELKFGKWAALSHNLGVIWNTLHPPYIYIRDLEGREKGGEKLAWI